MMISKLMLTRYFVRNFLIYVKNRKRNRLSSIESQPKKVDVVVVFIDGLVFVVDVVLLPHSGSILDSQLS